MPKSRIAEPRRASKRILLFNTSFKNKGDALMNEAILDELGNEHTWMIPLNLVLENRALRSRFSVCLISDLPSLTLKRLIFNIGVRLASICLWFAGSNVRKRLGLYTLRDVEVAIDVSGYCYGDPWGQARVDRGTILYRRLKEAGARIILMPKTWGPFSTISKTSILDMLTHVDVAYVRDSVSMSALQKAIGHSKKVNIKFAPDYTHRMLNSMSSANMDGTTQPVGYLIPSFRVIDSGTLKQDEYIGLLRRAAARLREHGIRPKLLIHETSSDLAFIDMASMLDIEDSDVLVLEDPIQLKSTIAKAKLIVTSRLHGLYNALNSQVPVAVIAWSFKYVEALKQYGCEECLVDLSTPQDSLDQIIDMLVHPSASAMLRQSMEKGAQNAEGITEKMWSDINRIVYNH